MTGQMAKGGVSLAKAIKNGRKVAKGGPPRLPASFGKAVPGKHYTDTFFDAHPDLKSIRDQIEVHHAVEQQTATKYPNVVSTTEIDSFQNLRGIKKGMIDPATGKEFHRSTIRKKWNEFYREYRRVGRDPTKQELLGYAAHIDDLYGHMFIPPVR